MAEKIISTPTLDDDCDMITFIRDKGATSVQRGFDYDSTTARQEFTEKNGKCDNDRTSVQRYSDTSAARSNKPKPPTDKEILSLNADLVKVLKNDRFVRYSTNGDYRNYLNFFDNVPKNLVKEVNKLGIKRADGREYTRETISRVVTAMKIERRFKPFTVWFIGIAVCFFSVYATLKISQFEFDFGSVGGGNGVLTSSFGGGYTLDIDKHINDLAKENRVTIYPFRRNKIKKEIQLSGDNSLKNIELIINNNINELKTLTK